MALLQRIRLARHASKIDGLLKPDKSRSFPDQSRVKLIIETIGADPDAPSAWKALKARLAQRPVHGEDVGREGEVRRVNLGDAHRPHGEGET